MDRRRILVHKTMHDGTCAEKKCKKLSQPCWQSRIRHELEGWCGGGPPKRTQKEENDTKTTLFSCCARRFASSTHFTCLTLEPEGTKCLQPTGYNMCQPADELLYMCRGSPYQHANSLLSLVSRPVPGPAGRQRAYSFTYALV